MVQVFGCVLGKSLRFTNYVGESLRKRWAGILVCGVHGLCQLDLNGYAFRQRYYFIASRLLHKCM